MIRKTLLSRQCKHFWVGINSRCIRVTFPPKDTMRSTWPRHPNNNWNCSCSGVILLYFFNLKFKLTNMGEFVGFCCAEHNVNGGILITFRSQSSGVMPAEALKPQSAFFRFSSDSSQLSWSNVTISRGFRTVLGANGKLYVSSSTKMNFVRCYV